MNRKQILSLLLVFSLLLSWLPGVAADTETKGQADEYPCSVLLGDVSADQAINAVDALGVLQHAVQKPSVLRQVKDAALMADVNADGSINAEDALEILQYAVEKRTAFSGSQQTVPSQDTLNREGLAALQEAVGQQDEEALAHLAFQYGLSLAPYTVDAAAKEASPSDAQWLPMLKAVVRLFRLPLYEISNRHNASEAAADITATARDTYNGVDGICISTATDEEKLMQLAEYGLLALPYLAERIQKGETQWEPYFEYQLLGLPAEEQYRVWCDIYSTIEPYATREEILAHIYQQSAAAAVPMDVPRWIEKHAELLESLRVWCTAYSAGLTPAEIANGLPTFYQYLQYDGGTSWDFPWPFRASNRSRYIRYAYEKCGFAFAPILVDDLPSHTISLDGPLYSTDLNALLTAAICLNIPTHQHWMLTQSITPQSLQYFIDRFVEYAQSTPAAVQSICDDSTLTMEEKLYRLSYYGMLAVPFILERIEKGETQWITFLEEQLLGLSPRERYSVLADTYHYPEWDRYKTGEPVSDAWRTQVYEIKKAAAKPLDVERWVEENQQSLYLLQYWCLHGTIRD